MSRYVIGIILLTFDACNSIPLPGLEILTNTVGELPVRPPYVQYSFGSPRGVSYIAPVQSETRGNDSVPEHQSSRFGTMNLESQKSFNSTQTQSQRLTSEQQTNISKPRATESPLAKMLNSLYGDSSWMKELGLVIDQVKTTTTTLNPIPNANMQNPIGNKLSGFYSNKVSVNSIGDQINIQPTHILPMITDYRETDRLHHLHNSVSKVNEKFVGNHFRINAMKYPTTSSPNSMAPVAIQRVDTLQTNLPVTGTVSHLPSAVDEIPTRVTQQNTASFPVDKSTTSAIGDNFSAGIGTFNANEINHAQHSFNPDKFFGQITQTGSDRANANHKISFDADAVNQNFAYGTLNKAPPGVDEASFGKKETTGNNQNTQTHSFDANALNMRLFAGQGNNPPGIGQFATPSSLNLQNPQTTDDPIPHNDILVTPRKNQPLSSNILSSETSRPEHVQSSFNFVPGKLFPGQPVNTHRNDIERANNGPSFLQNSRASLIHTKFDPNTLNSAQAIFNPNSLSWAHKRSTEFPIGTENDQLNTTHPDAIPIHQSASNTTFQTNPTEIFRFDPNKINSQSGQGSRFIPGQLTSGTSGNNAYSQGGQGMISTNNDVHNLLVLGNNKQPEGTHLVTGRKGFDPNFVNGAIANIFGNTKSSNVSYLDYFGTSFKGNGFDPNVANKGFGNVIGTGRENGTETTGFGFTFGQLEVSNSTHTSGLATGGFDPNSANAGFGPMLETGGMGGASSNKAFMTNPNGQNRSVSSSGSVMSYFGSGIGSNGGQNQYQSAFIGNFNPDTVNKAEYNPDKFNTMHLHFDPTDMLEKNPALDKATLQSAVFDPDKVNLVNWHQLLSPVNMISNSKQESKELYQTGQAKLSHGSDHNQVLFDPFKLMKSQLQSMVQFKPGTYGISQAHFDPMSMSGIIPVSTDVTTSSSKTVAVTPESTSSKSTAPQTTTASLLTSSILPVNSTKTQSTDTTVLSSSTSKTHMPTTSVPVQSSTRNITSPG